MPAISPTTPLEILEVFRAKIIRDVPTLNVSNTWYDDQPIPMGNDAIPRRFGCNLVMGDGKKASNANDGTVCGDIEDSSVLIAYQMELNGDKPKQLTDIISRMLAIERQLRVAVKYENPDRNEVWQPINANGDRILQEEISFRSVVRPKRLTNHPRLYMYLSYDVSFSWDLC